MDTNQISLEKAAVNLAGCSVRGLAMGLHANMGRYSVRMPAGRLSQPAVGMVLWGGIVCSRVGPSEQVANDVKP